MIGSEHMVEYRNFDSWSSTWPIALKIQNKVCRIKNHSIPARHFWARLLSRPSLTWPEGSGVQTSLMYLLNTMAKIKFSSRRMEPSDFTLILARWTRLMIYCMRIYRAMPYRQAWLYCMRIYRVMPACTAWLLLFSAYPLLGTYLLTTCT